MKFIKIRRQHRFFPVKFANILRTPILENIYERMFVRILQEELLNSTARFLHFNKCL